MSKFEFFFAFYGLLLGLGIAELLNGLAAVVRSEHRVRWGLLTPMAVGLIVLEFATAWLQAWYSFQTIQLDMRTLAAPFLVAVAYYFAAGTAVPRKLEAWEALDDYFMSHRRWIAGCLLAANLVILLIDMRTVPQQPLDYILFFYLPYNLLILSVYAVVIASPSRRVCAGAMAMLILTYLAFLTPFAESYMRMLAA